MGQDEKYSLVWDNVVQNRIDECRTTGQEWTVWNMTGQDGIRQDGTERCRMAVIEQDD